MSTPKRQHETKLMIEKKYVRFLLLLAFPLFLVWLVGIFMFFLVIEIFWTHFSILGNDSLTQNHRNTPKDKLKSKKLFRFAFQNWIHSDGTTERICRFHFFDILFSIVSCRTDLRQTIFICHQLIWQERFYYRFFDGTDSMSNIVNRENTLSSGFLLLTCAWDICHSENVQTTRQRDKTKK